MKIVFNLLATGLGNNGGSRTLIKCAETIQSLGHEVVLCASSNGYNWHPIKVEVSKIMPKCDVVIATGISSVSSTLKVKAKKFYYIRGYEIWRTNKSKLLKSYRQLKCIVNSEWLYNFMQSKQIDAKLIYPGLDFDLFYEENPQRDDIVGGIYSTKHGTKRHHDVMQVGKKFGYKILLLNRDIVNPSPDKLRKFYNKIKVWLSPSELEGLHNCPMEASLCGCGLVGTDHPRGGIQDYAVDQETALLYQAQNVEEAARKAKLLMDDNLLRDKLQRQMVNILKTKIGNRQDNMKKMVQVLEND